MNSFAGSFGRFPPQIKEKQLHYRHSLLPIILNQKDTTSISCKCHHVRQFSKSGLEEFWSYNFVVKTSLMIPKSIWEPFSNFHFPKWQLKILQVFTMKICEIVIFKISVLQSTSIFKLLIRK